MLKLVGIVNVPLIGP